MTPPHPPKPHHLLKRRTLLHGATATLLFGAWRIGWGSEIVAVRVWPAADYSRVTIESAKPLKTTQTMVESPPRLAVDIEGLQLDSTLRQLVSKVQPNDPNIADIRVGQFTPDVVRLVIDLKRPIRPEVFTLAPVAAYKDRLVFDLYPAKPVDPLTALLANMQHGASATAATKSTAVASTASPAATAAPQGDALGDLIARRIAEAAGTTPPPASAPSRNPPQVATAPTAPPVPASKGGARRLIIVAIDPGHGGEDPGATGPGGTHEKDVVLAIGLKLRDLVNASSVDGNPMRAFMTRDADYFVPLAMRVEKARAVHADLFISIHADSVPGSSATGTSVYALSERGATNTTARWLEKSENASDRVGGVNLSGREAVLQKTLLDMSTTSQIKDSMALARTMLTNIAAIGPLHRDQVERANFAVLRNPDVPSILVETAYISNPIEERKLRDPAFQRRMADAMLDGIKKYFTAHPPRARGPSA